MDIAIVDDVTTDRRELRECLLKWFTGSELPADIMEYQSGKDFIESCSQSVPDIVFMDIYIGEENGFEMIEQLLRITTDCIIIFISSSRDDALRSFRLHPFDYIVKPWSENTIFRVINEAVAMRNNSVRYVEFTVGRQKTRLPVSKIGYASSDNHHVRIVTVAGEEIKSFSTFAEVSKELLTDSRFLICNRGIIVNMDYIDKSTGKCFVMKNGESLPLKVKDIPSLEKTFAEYIFAHTRKWK